MKVFRCVFTGKDVFSDAFKFELKDDAWYIVEGKFQNVTYGVDSSLIGGNKSAEAEDDDCDDECELKCNVVESGQLEECPSIVGKADFKSAYQTYIKKLLAYLKENNPERYEVINARKGELGTHIYKNCKNFSFFGTEGDAYDLEGIFIPMEKVDCPDGMEKEGTVCKFWVLKDGLEEVGY